MGEATQSKEGRKDERSRAQFLMVFLGIGLSQLLSKGEFLSESKAFLLSWSIAFLIGYWLPPRPTQTFLRWVLESSIVVLAVYLIFFLMPMWLKGKTPLLYYGIPILACVALFILARRLSFFCSDKRA